MREFHTYYSVKVATFNLNTTDKRIGRMFQFSFFWYNRADQSFKCQILYLCTIQQKINSFPLFAVYTIRFSKVLLLRIIFILCMYFILYVLISLINSADSIIRSKWTLSQQPRVEIGVLTTLSVWSFNNNEEKRIEIDF